MEEVEEEVIHYAMPRHATPRNEEVHEQFQLH